MATAATRVGIAVLLACGGILGGGRATRAHAGPAADLGAALRAYDAGDLAGARRLLARLDEKALANRDYLLWLRGMVALRGGEPAAARAAFERLAKVPGSRFAREVPWRLADAAWDAGDRAGAARQYARLAGDKDDDTAVADVGTARFRIAEARDGAGAAAAAAAAAAYRAFWLAHPVHPLAARAERRLAELGAPAITPAERIERAKQLLAARLWDEAVDELALVGDPPTPELARQRDYWLGTALFKMRRRYADAGKLLLGVYKDLGASAPEAMFHGARALSRADRDDEAITWYGKVVDAYPRTAWAEEAQYLRGWLQFNRGRYREAIAQLDETLRRYPRSKWTDDALWFIGLSHYLLGEHAPARARLEALERRGGALEGGKGTFWLARLDEKLGAKDAAIAGYTKVVQRYPFSWYALLGRARAKALGVDLPPFGIADPTPRGARLAAAPPADGKLAADPLIARADELIAAGLLTDAGRELAREERAFLRRHERAAGLAMLLDRYRRAGNFTRPWTMAVVYHGGALGGPPEGDARRWWEHAYPRAFQPLVEKHQARGGNPDGYLYSIMRQESGFDPHVVSYADARGLLQMIPPTTMRVAKELGIPYDAGRLFEPEYNVQTGSWYIGSLLAKFKGQVPLGAGSFNSGPRPVMRWIDQHGDRPMDELVELVPYTQTRDYMKHVTEHFARYRYLYLGEVYEQPLVVDKRYVRDQLTF